VKDELGEEHLCFFVHRAVEHMDLKSFEPGYGEEGGALYCPALMLKVWLYVYALGITSARWLEQPIREDLGLRYLGGARPDSWAVRAFRRRHARGLNEVFTQVLEMARQTKLGRLGQVTIDATRIHAAASRNPLETEERLRQERSRLRRSIRKWKLCAEDDPNEGAGTRVHLEKLQEQLRAMPRRLEKPRKSGMKKVSRTDDEDARLLREGSGFALGYTSEAAVNEDHMIVGQRVMQHVTDNSNLIPMVKQAERQSVTKAERERTNRKLETASKKNKEFRGSVASIRLSQ
jgi:transposase